MKRFLVALSVAGVALGSLTPVLAHEGGHSGGCKEFGQANQAFAPDLGKLVSSFATTGPGVVAGIVETFDHAACGP